MPETYTLRGVLDLFIPHAMRANAGRQSQLRLFVLVCLLAGVTGLAGSGLLLAQFGLTTSIAVMLAASAALLIPPYAIRWPQHTETTLFSGYLLILCATVSSCSALGGLTAPTLPLLLPLPVLAYLWLQDKNRRIGLATFVGSILSIVLLEWQADAPAILLAPMASHALLAGAMVFAAAVMTLLLWKLDSYQTYLREQQRNETLREHVAVENLELAKQTAERDSLAKSRLLASVSMDLRAPLTAIIGFSQIIGHEMMGAIGNRQYRSYAEDIESSGYKVLETIERVLDLARLQAGDFRLKEEWLDLADLLRRQVDDLKPMAANSEVRFSLEIPDEQVMVFADPRAVRQIMLNLLTNALRYVEFGGKTVATLKHGASGDAVISIWNDGPSIPPEHLPFLFDPGATYSGLGVEQSTQEQADRPQGLGLPVSRLLAERHGGSLTVKSTPSDGTTVSVVLPPERVSIASHGKVGVTVARAKKIYPLAALQAPDGR